MPKSDLLERFERYILESGLQPGDRLPKETELAERFGASRGTLREAIAYLTAKGVLERRTSRGTVLRVPDAEDIANDLAFQLKLLHCGKAELNSARQILETSIVPSLVRHATPRQIDLLAEVNREMLACTHDRPRADALDLRFHLELFEITGNRLLKIFAQIITVQFEGKLRPPFRDAAAVEISGADHQAMIAAIAARDATALGQAIHDHIEAMPM